MKTRKLFYLAAIATLAFTISSCGPEKESASVEPKELTFEFNGGTKSALVNLGNHLYYGATVDEDGEGWCTVETPGEGKVDITVSNNIELTPRSCYVNCYVADTTNPTEEAKILLPVLVKQDAAVSSGTYQGYEWVNLGLPSGTLWATCNVGADTPEEWGQPFSWGETTTKAKEHFTWPFYKYCMGTNNTLTKYCLNDYMGYQGFTDGLNELLPEDDAATMNWGDGWCTPSLTQIRELSRECHWEWVTTENGVKGNKYTGPNGNSIFIPADADGHYSTIWASVLWSDSKAWKFTQGGDTYGIDDGERCGGRRVRPVRKQ